MLGLRHLSPYLDGALAWTGTAVNVATQHIFRCWPELFYFYPMDGGGHGDFDVLRQYIKTSVQSF